MSEGNARRAVSYLVRLWVEDRETLSDESGLASGLGSARSRGRGPALGDGEQSSGEIVRGFVRNLQTGEERYVSDSDRLARALFRGLELEVEDKTEARGDESETHRATS